MNKYIKIGNCYYQINDIRKLGFKICEQKISTKCDVYGEITENFNNPNYYIILINDEQVFVDEQNYKRIKKQFLEILGEENIYD